MIKFVNIFLISFLFFSGLLYALNYFSSRRIYLYCFVTSLPPPTFFNLDVYYIAIMRLESLVNHYGIIIIFIQTDYLLYNISYSKCIILKAEKYTIYIY